VFSLFQPTNRRRRSRPRHFPEQQSRIVDAQPDLGREDHVDRLQFTVVKGGRGTGVWPATLQRPLGDFD
jgi:hypothetical protein